jgi:tetratricopeptide (TPR) repeat protein
MEARAPAVHDPAEVWFWSSLATLDAAEASRRLEEALRRDPRHVRSLEHQAALLEARGRLEGVLACTDRLLVLRPRSVEWIRGRATTLIRLDRMDDALRALDRLIGDGGPFSRLARKITGFAPATHDYVLRAQVERRLGLYHRALEDLDAAIGRGGTSYSVAWAHSHRATVHWILGHPDEAVRDYRRSYEFLGPSYGAVRAAIILREKGRSAEAEELLGELLAQTGGGPELAWLQSIAACIAGRSTPESLIEEAKQVGDLQRLCEAYCYAAEASLAAGGADSARAWFQECLATGLAADPETPQDPMSEYELARWRLGDARLVHPMTRSGSNDPGAPRPRPRSRTAPGPPSPADAPAPTRSSAGALPPA